MEAKAMVKKAFSFFLKTLLIFLIAVSVFYFWGSSSEIDIDKYSSIYTNGERLKSEVDTFRLMTYNIGYLSGMTNNKPVDRSKDLFDHNLDRLNILVDEMRVDICCFQEVDFNADRSFNVDQLTEIRSDGNFPHSSQVINWDKKYVPFPYWPPSNQFGKVVSGQAILSSFPIVKNDRIVLQKGDYPFYYNAFYLDRLAQVNLISIGDRDVLFINVHLEAFDARTREKQADQLIELYKMYEDEYPILLVGDFNSTPPGAKEPYMEENTIDKLLEIEGLKMAISGPLYLSDETKYFTFNSSDPYIKIDFIFYNENKIKVENARVLSEAGDISDHLPVIADIILLNQ